MIDSDKHKKELETLRVNDAKWSKPLMQAGWIAFPSIILEKQSALGLTALDINIILHLATYWWTADNKPKPSKNSIAQALGVSARTVQRRVAMMEASGFIRREERRIAKEGSKPNIYHFDGLIKEATPYAQEKIEMITQKRQDEEARRTRKRAKLTVVKPSED